MRWRISSSSGDNRSGPGNPGSHASVAGKAEEGDSRLGRWGRCSSHHRGGTESTDGGASHAYQAKEKGHAPSTELWFEPRQPEDLFAPLAHSAAKLFADVDRNRVRKCDQCVLHFHDTSKKGTRRWCSMQLCGNRLKVAAYAARRRGHALRQND